MNFDETVEFSREMKKLAKKWRTLPKDLLFAERTIISKFYEDKKFKKDFFDTKKATVLFENEKSEVVKMRLDCSSPGNRDLLRLIFIYIKTDNGILLVELYAKNENLRENKSRIKKYLC